MRDCCVSTNVQANQASEILARETLITLVITCLIVAQARARLYNNTIAYHCKMHTERKGGKKTILNVEIIEHVNEITAG